MSYFMLLIAFLLFSGCQESSVVPPPPEEVPTHATLEMLCAQNPPFPELIKYPFVKRIILVILENEDGDITLSLPQFKELATKGSYLNQYHALYHPSQPNYFAMTGGSNFGHLSNLVTDLDAPNIADLIEQTGRTWQVFAENYPGNCYLGRFAEPDAPTGLYARKHNPLISYKQISGNPERCNKITNAADFFTMWKNDQLPNFSMYIPNNQNNGHDNGVAIAAEWVKKNFADLVVDKTLMKDTLFILTFDEDAARTIRNQNRVYTLFIGPMVKSNLISHHCYNHFSLLRTIEELWNLNSLNQFDKTARPIVDIWSTE